MFINVNIMFVISVVAAVYIITIIKEMMRNGRKDRSIKLAVHVLFSLCWWCITDAMFFISETSDIAMFWHQAGAFGWCGFVAFTCRYFVAITGNDKDKPLLLRILFWVVPLFLTVRFTLYAPTAFAEKIIASTSGLGWTFVQGYNTIWPCLYILYLLIYMGASFLLLYVWQKGEVVRMQKDLAKSFILLDATLVLFGFISVFLLPVFTYYIPPLTSVAVFAFAIGYWNRIRTSDLNYMANAVNIWSVIDSDINAMVLTDENFRIIYFNNKSNEYFNCRRGGLFTENLDRTSVCLIEDFASADISEKRRFNIRLKGSTSFLCSAGKTISQSGYTVYVFNLSEITDMQMAKEQLDYLHRYDELTGLLNRKSFSEELSEWISVNNEGFELIVISIGNLKEINYTYGFASGDKTLIITTDAMKKAVGDSAVLARISGNKFAVLCKSSTADTLIDRLTFAVETSDVSEINESLCITAYVSHASRSEATDKNELISLAGKRLDKIRRV